MVIELEDLYFSNYKRNMYHSFLIHSSADGHLGCFHSSNIFFFCSIFTLN